MKKKIKISWSCPLHHEHKFWLVAYLCCFIQKTIDQIRWLKELYKWWFVLSAKDRTSIRNFNWYMHRKTGVMGLYHKKGEVKE